jgi:hypothetical protein
MGMVRVCRVRRIATPSALLLLLLRLLRMRMWRVRWLLSVRLVQRLRLAV